jgi:hypothetical protein
MVGSFVDRAVAEPIFREYIAEMSDERLEKAAVDTIPSSEIQTYKTCFKERRTI